MLLLKKALLYSYKVRLYMLLLVVLHLLLTVLRSGFFAAHLVSTLTAFVLACVSAAAACCINILKEVIMQDASYICNIIQCRALPLSCRVAASARSRCALMLQQASCVCSLLIAALPFAVSLLMLLLSPAADPAAGSVPEQGAFV
jgi:hypothetical protein